MAGRITIGNVVIDHFSDVLWDFLIPLDQLFPNVTEEAWDHTASGIQRPPVAEAYHVVHRM